MARRPRPALDANRARAEIRRILSNFLRLQPAQIRPVANIVGGKLYELFVLAKLLPELRARGWRVSFRGNTIMMFSSPGPIDAQRPHFELRRTPNGAAEFEIYTDINVGTLGSTNNRPRDRSAFHEIDIVVVPANTMGIPAHDLIALGIECKATANFEKSFVREVLGRRRELSYLVDAQPCMLDGSVLVRAEPASEYWLVYIDPTGNNYRLSPDFFSVDLKHWQP